MKRTFVLLSMILLCAYAWAQRNGDYRSNGTVRLNAAASWQLYNGSNWINTTIAPSTASLNNNNTITIRANHTWNNTVNVNMPNRNFTFLMQSNSVNFTAGTSVNRGTLSTAIFENSSGTTSYAVGNQAFNNLEIRRSGTSGNYTASFNGSAFTVNNNFTVGANSSFGLTAGTLTLNGNNKTFTTTGNLSFQSSTVNITGNSVTMTSNGTVALSNSTINFEGNNAKYYQEADLNMDNSIIDFKGNNAEMSQEGNINFLNTSTGSSFIKFLASNGKIDLKAAINGASATNYIQLGKSSTAAKNFTILLFELEFPIGTANNYLPLSVERGLFNFPTLTAGVFEGVTNNGQSNGTAFTNAQKSSLVDAVWRLTSSANFTPTSINLGWQQPLEGSTFASLNNNIGMSYFNTETNDWTTSFGAGNGLLNTVNRSTSVPTIGTAGMSFGVGMIGVILPIRLTDFRAVQQQSTVQLSWTANTQGSSYFEVERASSLNGNYVSIAKINTDGTGEQNYQFTDPRPMKDGYYRIKTVAENREPAYSSALKVQFGDNRFSLEKLYPTVSQGQLTLVISNSKTESVTIDIVDLGGRTHMHESKQLSNGSNQYQLNTDRLPNGYYVVLIQKADTKVTGRFMRQ